MPKTDTQAGNYSGETNGLSNTVFFNTVKDEYRLDVAKMALDKPCNNRAILRAGRLSPPKAKSRVNAPRATKPSVNEFYRMGSFVSPLAEAYRSFIFDLVCHRGCAVLTWIAEFKFHQGVILIIQDSNIELSHTVLARWSSTIHLLLGKLDAVRWSI